MENRDRLIASKLSFEGLKVQTRLYSYGTIPVVTRSSLCSVSGKRLLCNSITTNENIKGLAIDIDYFLVPNKEYVKTVGRSCQAEYGYLFAESGVRKLIAKYDSEYNYRLTKIADGMAALRTPKKPKLNIDLPVKSKVHTTPPADNSENLSMQLEMLIKKVVMQTIKDIKHTA